MVITSTLPLLYYCRPLRGPCGLELGGLPRVHGGGLPSGHGVERLPSAAEQVAEVCAVGAADAHQAAVRHDRAQRGERGGSACRDVGQVHLRQCDYLRRVAESIAVEGQLPVDGEVVVIRRVALAVDQVEQQPAALRVPQKGEPQPAPRVRPLDQPRDVEPHHRGAGPPQLERLELAHAKVRNDRGERVVRHLWARPRDGV
mmetsp:Transcript_47638/g.107343  ORF Transcript_47638/g.107343 Transcript_47638/m.107343 type:complete len:201 (-) Transcript_47638:19-621(-)